MPSRKQRRRREKAHRHEWEYVEVDPETGEERPLDPAELRPEKPERPKERPKAAQPQRGRGGRATRPIEPPSWRRSVKRALPWQLALLALVLFVLKGPVGSRVAIALLYAVALVPFTYWVDKFAYDRYLKRSGQAPPKGGGSKR